MVAGGGGDDTKRSFRMGKSQQSIERAALLERTRHLQVLKLEIYGCVCLPTERLGACQGRQVHGVGDASAGSKNVIEWDHVTKVGLPPQQQQVSESLLPCVLI